jgi:hypothetical protein
MKYDRVLAITGIDIDTEAIFAAIRQFAPAAKQLTVIVQQPARQFAWLTAEAPPDLNEATRKALDAVRQAAGKAARLKKSQSFAVKFNGAIRKTEIRDRNELDVRRVLPEIAFKKLDAAYETKGNLFGNPERVSNDQFEAAWRARLKKEAGFKFVSKPMPMKTKTDSIIYYLYFASQKPVPAGIVDDIFEKHRKRQGL